ncbi:MAG: Crp/Fnr family transcriptional regulator [Vulcanimicrobiota bacterium]
MYSCHSCQQCADCGHKLLTGVAADTLDIWNSAKVTRTLGRGNILFREGEASGGVYCTESGLLKLFRTSLHGEVQIVRLVHGREVVGHRSLLTGEPLTASATAVRDTRLCFVDAATVQRCLKMDPTLSLNLARLLARDLGHSEGQLFNLSQMDTCARLSRLLLELRQPNGCAVELTRAEMSQMVGASPESVSRTLQALARVGAVRLVCRRIVVEDLPLLQSYAGT